MGPSKAKKTPKASSTSLGVSSYSLSQADLSKFAPEMTPADVCMFIY